MTKTLELNLVEKYPELFINYGGDVMKTCMHWGCEHGDGWYKIIDDLSYYLANFNSGCIVKLKDGGYKKVGAPKVVFEQIKAKFKTLRVYHEWGEGIRLDEFLNPEEAKMAEQRFKNQLDGIISAAEMLSEITCQSCGKKKDKKEICCRGDYF